MSFVFGVLFLGELLVAACSTSSFVSFRLPKAFTKVHSNLLVMVPLRSLMCVVYN